jgi:hypothetical protein
MNMLVSCMWACTAAPSSDESADHAGSRNTVVGVRGLEPRAPYSLVNDRGWQRLPPTGGQLCDTRSPVVASS